MAGTVDVDTSKLGRKIEELSSEVKTIDTHVNEIGHSVDQVQVDLKELRTQFDQMMNDQKRAASLQRAATELVRVRQEIEQNFGNYRVIRETMLGALQATDLALVKKDTISRVSEELMLSTPNYWLAPCLVAISAWIGNDRDLANRAIAESVKRDEERTALTMALICRRNNRADVCHEWLALYFSNQNAAHFSEGSFVYIDAYINGVFGVDKMHLCDDYIGRWLAEIRGSSVNFEKKQNEIWKNYCAGFTCGLGDQYSELSKYAVEYDRISAYLERVNAAEAVLDDFGGLMSTEVNQGVMKERIDKNLIELISRYNDDEQPLRREEAYLLAIKKHDGNEGAAKAEIMAKERRRLTEAKNIVEQMVEAITGGDSGALSQKKTAVSFLGGYISKGIVDYVNEKKELFPKAVTLSVNGWNGTSEDGENTASLQQSYVAYNEEKRTSEIKAVENSTPKKFIIAAVVCAVLTFLGLAIMPVISVFALVGAVFFGIKALSFKTVKARKIEQINQNYDTLAEDGKKHIGASLSQWQEIKKHTDQFGSKPIHVVQ